MSDVRGFKAAIGSISRIRERARDPRPALEEAADIAGETIHRNFEVSGRPRWKPHAESTRRGIYGPSRLLIRSSDLENSFKPFVTRRNAIQRSSGLAYSFRQNDGYRGGPGRGHSPTPARTFVIFQNEDAEQLVRVMLNHVVK